MIAEEDFAGRQSRGARDLQEDAYAFSEIDETGEQKQGLLLVVADGLGGHAAGEQASEIAVKSFVAAFHKTTGKIDNRLRTALNAANGAIAAAVQRDPRCEGMGTTLLAVVVTFEGIEWISVGDSPLYLFGNGKLNQLNEDHSLRPVLKEMAENKTATADEPPQSAKNILRAALIGDEISMIDVSPKPTAFAESDCILAATDGIRVLSDEGMQKICNAFAEAEASTLVNELLQAVRDADNPKQDNTTVAIIKGRCAMRG